MNPPALVPDPDVAHITTCDGTVLLNVEHGQLYGLNPTGSIVWQALSDRKGVEEITGDLAARFPAARERIPSDVEAVITKLHARGLLTPRG